MLIFYANGNAYTLDAFDFFVPPLDANEGRWEEHSQAMTLKKNKLEFKKARKSISSLYAKKSHAASDAGVSLKS